MLMRAPDPSVNKSCKESEVSVKQARLQVYRVQGIRTIHSLEVQSISEGYDALEACQIKFIDQVWIHLGDQSLLLNLWVTTKRVHEDYHTQGTNESSNEGRCPT